MIRVGLLASLTHSGAWRRVSKTIGPSDLNPPRFLRQLVPSQLTPSLEYTADPLNFMEQLMTIRHLLALSVLVSCAWSGCTTIDVKTDFDPSADFTRFHTFAFVGLTDLNRGGVLDNSLMRKRLEAIIAKELTQKGLRHIALDEHPDLLVHYWVGIREKQQIQSTGPAVGAYGWRGGYGWRAGYGGDIRTYDYNEGTLITDLVEPGTNELVWRATMVANLEDTTQENIKLGEEALAKAFEEYPPKATAR